MDDSVLRYLKSWHSAPGDPLPACNYSFPMVQLAFQDGMERFASHLTKDANKVLLSTSFAGMQNIQSIVSEAFEKYSDGQKYPSARKWLHRIVSKIHHYCNIVDVLVQHHPEYVALLWGAMKVVLISAQNHETTICLLAKSLAQIADSLPRIELNTVLYPTERMRRAVGNLYANLIRFLIRAYEWCQEGPWRHILHSITRPVELRYKDLLEDIAAGSREIDQLAATAARVEIREISLKLNDVLLKLDSMHTLHSSSLLDTNQRLSDLQFSQIMSYISDSKLGDPHTTYRFNQYLRKLHAQNQRLEVTNEFWRSPKLQSWSTVPESKLAVVKGGFRARFAMRNFCVNMIQQLQSENVPVLWALRGPQQDHHAGQVSVVDIFKHLMLQALRIQQGSTTESGLSLRCAQFHSAITETEWLQLLGSVLSSFRSPIYVVIDISTLDRFSLPVDGFSWLASFQGLFAETARRSPTLQIKVLLLGDSSHGLQMSELSNCDSVVSAKVTQKPIRRGKRVSGNRRMPHVSQ